MTHAQVGSSYPRAVDPEKVGTYPGLTRSGGGYFWDEVLEYRVWVHPQTGSDEFLAFATYEQALAYSLRTPGAEEPCVLVRQWEHVNEPHPGVFEHVKGERLTEWDVAWLPGRKRGPDTIREFLEKNCN